MAWVIDFFTKNPKCKKRKYIFFVFCVGEGGGGRRRGWAGGKCFFFFLQRIEIYTFFGGGGMEGVVWRGGSVARVDVNSFYKYRNHNLNETSIIILALVITEILT